MIKDEKLFDLIEKSRRLSGFQVGNKKELKEKLLKRELNKAK